RGQPHSTLFPYTTLFRSSLPRVHVAVMPVEKVLPRFADLGVMLPLLTRSATGQRLSTYVSMITGPRRPGETDGPERMHVVFLDRSEEHTSELQSRFDLVC